MAKRNTLAPPRGRAATPPVAKDVPNRQRSQGIGGPPGPDRSVLAIGYKGIGSPVKARTPGGRRAAKM